MRSISTLLLLFFTVSVTAQTTGIGQPVTVVCLGISKKAVEKKDTVKNGFVCKTGGIEVVKKDSVVGYKGSVCHATSSITSNSQPLFIVDGEIAKSKYLSVLNPNDIDSIWVLKSAVAQAIYGSEGYNGAIIITTKKTNKFIIKDFTDGNAIPGATVLLTSVKNRNEKFQFIADDSGVVTTQKLKRDNRYEMTVSAIGHITSLGSFKTSGSSENKIFLNRDAKTCDEVIIKAYPTRTIACGGGSCTLWCVCSGMNITVNGDKEQPHDRISGFKIYPNPVQRGASLSLQFDNTGEKEKIVRIVSLDGKTLLQKGYPANEGKNIFRLLVDARWAAGTYFVQLLYENGRVLASEKIIVQ